MYSVEDVREFQRNKSLIITPTLSVAAIVESYLEFEISYDAYSYLLRVISMSGNK